MIFTAAHFYGLVVFARRPDRRRAGRRARCAAPAVLPDVHARGLFQVALVCDPGFWFPVRQLPFSPFSISRIGISEDANTYRHRRTYTEQNRTRMCRGPSYSPDRAGPQPQTAQSAWATVLAGRRSRHPRPCVSRRVGNPGARQRLREPKSRRVAAVRAS